MEMKQNWSQQGGFSGDGKMVVSMDGVLKDRKVVNAVDGEKGDRGKNHVQGLFLTLNARANFENIIFLLTESNIINFKKGWCGSAN